jgi:hypothetical protein
MLSNLLHYFSHFIDSLGSNIQLTAGFMQMLGSFLLVIKFVAQDFVLLNDGSQLLPQESDLLMKSRNTLHQGSFPLESFTISLAFATGRCDCSYSSNYPSLPQVLNWLPFLWKLIKKSDLRCRIAFPN